MPDAGLIYDRIFQKLSLRNPLDATDSKAIRGLPFERRTIDASSYLVREGQTPQRCAFLLEGFTYRQKLTIDGQRSVVSIQIPGDFVDLQNLLLGESDHDVQALTTVNVAEFNIADLRRLAVKRVEVGKAMWIDSLIEASIFREWLLNVGRRSARGRIAHLLCEFSVRLQAAGLSAIDSYSLPMTQEQLGDALGLTAVHVNRMLKYLQRDGLIERRKRLIRIMAWSELRQEADFNDRYLHFDQTSRR